MEKREGVPLSRFWASGPGRGTYPLVPPPSYAPDSRKLLGCPESNETNFDIEKSLLYSNRFECDLLHLKRAYVEYCLKKFCRNRTHDRD